MPVPTYDQFIEPILRYLAATPEGATARDAHEAAADALNLSEAQRRPAECAPRRSTTPAARHARYIYTGL